MIKLLVIGDSYAGKTSLLNRFVNNKFERHYNALFRFFRTKVGDQEQALDLVQKSFLGCLESMDRYDPERPFRAWLYGIAYRQLLKHFRDRASEQARLDWGTVSARDLDPTPSSLLARSDEQRLLLEALRRIPLDMQIALELHYWEQMSDAEIARTLGLALGTAKSRIRRARIVLNERLAELAESPEQLRATADNLEAWARQLRDIALDG